MNPAPEPPDTLVPLPAAAADHRWPAEGWEFADPPPTLDPVLDEAFGAASRPELALSLAVVVVHRGRLVAERYGPDTDAATTLISWSTAKSITQAAVGIAVADGRLDIDQRGVAPEWGPDDPRHELTLRHLLTMRSGLEFNEDYVDADSSHCLEMLYGSGAADTAHYVALLPAQAPADTVFNYSSGTTNLISRRLGAAVGGAPGVVPQFLDDRLFGPLGMTSASVRCDDAGTFVGSSYVYATARDYARFGELYLRDGVWEGRRLLPEGWVDLARAPRSYDEDTGLFYGHHWWIRGDELGTFGARGYEGQRITCVPALDLVVVRLGKTPVEFKDPLDAWMERLADCFR